MLETAGLTEEAQAKLDELRAAATDFFARIDSLTSDSEALKRQVASLEERLAIAEEKLATR